MKRRVIIFDKPDGLGCISVDDDGTNVSVRAFDSRCGVKTANALIPSGSEGAYVQNSIEATKERGWQMIYDGEPNYG